jgi:hypothetical protein
VRTDVDSLPFYINKRGRTVLTLSSWARWPFSDGLTITGKSGSRVYMDTHGEVIAPYERDLR